MKLTGFIMEHSMHLKNTSNAIPFKQLKREELQDKNQILSFLKSGIPISATMMLLYSLIQGESSKIIGGLGILTDGKWIWPSYLEYYVNHYDLELDVEFVNCIRDKNYTVPNLEQEIKNRANEFIHKAMMM